MPLAQSKELASGPGAHSSTPPIGLKWRSSYNFTTLIVGLGIATDLLVYSIIIPVMPFQLQRLGYQGVSALTGWLLFAYSAGLVLSTIPIAMLSERYNNRRIPLILGLILLIGSQVLLMEAPDFPVMCISRVLQGFGSTVVWVNGLALLCDATPERYIGRQLGFAMAGLAIGSLAGPPIGGALYSRFGFRAPFICGIIVAFFDLIGRLVIIERKEALRWNFDPAAVPDGDKETAEGSTSTLTLVKSGIKLSLAGVMSRLLRSPRAVVVITVTFLYGIIYSAQEPTLPLRLNHVWDLRSHSVGLVYLAGVIPTFFSAPLVGWYSDRKGVEWPLVICISMAIPWWIVMASQRSLGVFIFAYVMGSFFISGLVSPVMAELAAVSRGIDGVGYAHVYGAFNLVYGIAGPIIGGQIFTHVKEGWLIINLLSAGLLAVAVGLIFFYTGENPLVDRLMRSRKGAITVNGS
ncbi:major facilitator superfamily domain-containing protein [Mycena galopus ATCC 62051]|nr:major facilitator superfamily domain-containing protein [Mycena galopus ATCC 62051]